MTESLDLKEYEVTFYYKGYPTLDSPIIITALDLEWAKQVLNLMKNTKVNLPGNWDRHDPIKLRE